MEKQVTDERVLVQVAKEVLEVLHKHGVRRREVPMVLQSVWEQLDSQPVQGANDYPDSR